MEGIERGLAQGKEQGLAQGKIRELINSISNMQNMNLPKDVIIQALSLDVVIYLTFSNLIHSHEDFTLDELVDEYFNSTNDTDEENESDSETT